VHGLFQAPLQIWVHPEKMILYKHSRGSLSLASSTSMYYGDLRRYQLSNLGSNSTAAESGQQAASPRCGAVAGISRGGRPDPPRLRIGRRRDRDAPPQQARVFACRVRSDAARHHLISPWGRAGGEARAQEWQGLLETDEALEFASL
jgi:hypothetical protein